MLPGYDVSISPPARSIIIAFVLFVTPQMELRQNASVCLCLSVFVPVRVSVSLSSQGLLVSSLPYSPPSPFLCLSLSPSVFFSVCLSVCLSGSFSHTVSLSLLSRSLSHSPCLCHYSLAPCLSLISPSALRSVIPAVAYTSSSSKYSGLVGRLTDD